MAKREAANGEFAASKTDYTSECRAEENDSQEPFHAIQYAKIPNELKTLRQWVGFKLSWNEQKLKFGKIPINPRNGKFASISNPSTWGTFEEALHAREKHGLYGIGFAFTLNDPYSGIDLDGCRDPETGKIEKSALDVLNKIQSYSESSQSGGGVHIIVKSNPLSCGSHGHNRKQHEIYFSKRFFIFTGNVIQGFQAIEERTEEVEEYHQQTFHRDKRESKGNGRDRSNFWKGEIPSGERHDLIRAKVYSWRIRGIPRDKVMEMALEASRLNGKDDKKEIERLVNGAFYNFTTIQSVEDVTDMRNGSRFAECYRDVVRFNHLQRSFYVWNGTHWERDNSGYVQALGKQLMHEMLEATHSIMDEDQRRKVKKKIIDYESWYRIQSFLETAKSEPGVPIQLEDFDRDKFLLNVSNGTIDLRTKELKSHDPKDLISKIAPVEYNPAAFAQTWKGFIDEIFDFNQNIISFVQKALGYALTGDVREQCFFLLHGIGSNGKSTLLKTVSSILGDYALSSRAETFMVRKSDGIPNDVARLHKARMVVAVEIEKGKQFAEAMIKALTGGDMITARFLRQEFFEFQPEFKAFLAVNHKPEIKGTDTAIWRRVRLIPFEIVIPDEEQDKELEQKLAAESSGILNWMIEGCIQWQTEGLSTPDEIKTVTSEYREQMDTLGDFIADRCTEAPTLTAQANPLYREYTSWAKDSGESQMSQKDFSETLVARGFRKKKGNTGIIYLGIGINAKHMESEG